MHDIVDGFPEISAEVETTRFLIIYNICKWPWEQMIGFISNQHGMISISHDC